MTLRLASTFPEVPSEQSRPGAYGQFCPLSRATEVVCQRWTPQILRELLLGSTRFNEIRRGVPTCSPATLAKRLKELQAAGVVNHDPIDATYTLTEAGKELLPVIQGLGEWGHRWVRTEYGPDDLDPTLLLWDFGEARTVVQITFPNLPAPRRYYWVVDDGRDVDLCLTDPGTPVDAEITADLRVLTQIWLGDACFDDALKDGSITLQGPAHLTRTIPDWFGQHPVMAKVVPGAKIG
jgi:DNA-binding HxlR family transcriptional regulator